MDELDFSHYTETHSARPAEQPNPNIPPGKSWGLRHWIIIVVFLAGIIIAGAVLINSEQPKEVTIPEEYRLTSPTEGPPKLERIK
jgi:hypothetical protein